MSRKPALIAFAILVVAYLFIAAAYALNTPPWQAPDEPAHYNTIRFIAEQGALPVLQSGDYDEAYNTEFTRMPQNAQSMSIDPFRYEFYSPPLYYLLAAPFYSLTNGSLIAIRLFSVVLSALLISVAFLIGAELFPNRLEVALGAAAFVAFVPQHVAMMSAVNNDSLAELLIALCIWQSMRLFKSEQPSSRSLLLLGVTLGLGLLTKQTVYYTAAPIVVITLVLHWRAHSANLPTVIAREAKQSQRQSAETPALHPQRGASVASARPSTPLRSAQDAPAQKLLLLCRARWIISYIISETSRFAQSGKFLPSRIPLEGWNSRNDVSPVTRHSSLITRHSLLITHYSLALLPALILGSILWIHNLQVYGGLDVLGLARHNSIVIGQPTSSEWIAQYGFGGLLSRGLTTTFHSFWGQFGWMAVPMPDSTYLLLGLLSIVALVGWVWWLVEGRKGQGAKASGHGAIILSVLFVLTVGGFIYYNLTFVQHQGRYLFPALIPLGLMASIGLDHILTKIFGLIKNRNRWITISQLLIFAAVFIMLARLDIIALQRYIIPFLAP